MIDTVDLYFLKARQRRLSLKFLSWFVLHENIQIDTHDSIEDARSTLLLYKAYHEFEEQGTFDQKLEELYKAGKQFVSTIFSAFDRDTSVLIALQNWKPPPPEGVTSSTPQPRGSTDSPAPNTPDFTIARDTMVQQTPPQKFRQPTYPSSHSGSPAPIFFQSPSSNFSPNWRQRR